MLTKSDGRAALGWLCDEKKERSAPACELSQLHFARICCPKRRPEMCQRPTEHSLSTICRLLPVAARVDADKTRSRNSGLNGETE